MVKIITIIFACIFSFGCATIDIPVMSFPKAEFEKTEEFVLEDNVKKPGKPQFILLDSNFNVIKEQKNAAYIAFNPDEFAKIVALSEAFDAQEEVISGLADLLNIRVDEINALKELIAVKEILSEHLAQLYANEQKIRQEEARMYMWKDAMNRFFLVVKAGVIIALAIAL